MITNLVEILDLPKKSEISHKKNEDIEKLQDIVYKSKNGKSSSSYSSRKIESSEGSYTDAVESLLEICRSLMRQGDSLLAIKQIKRFLFTEPRSLESHSFISLLYMKVGNYFKSYQHIMGVRFITNDYDYDAKIASGSILDTLIFQICKLPLGLKSKSLIGFKFDDELPFDERKLEYVYQYKFEKLNFPLGHSSTTLDKFNTPVATNQINVGDLIHVEEPYALAPELPSDLSIQTTCFHCLREREVYDHAFSCSVHPNTCPFVFCRWECMVKHSRRHELECEFIGPIVVISNHSGLPVSFLLLALRCLIQTHLDSVSLLVKTEGVSQKLLDLPSYSDIIEIISPNLYSIFDLITEEFFRIIPIHLRLYFSRKELKLFLITLYSNKLPVTVNSASSSFNSSPVPISTGLGFFEKACKFQHSCIPSCVYYINDEHKLCIRSAYNIPENANLTISYLLDLYQPTFKRKSIINSPKVFACMCSRCLDDSENELFLEGIRCPFCVIGFFVPSPIFKKLETAESSTLQTNVKAASKNIIPRKLSIFSRDKPVKDSLLTPGAKSEDKLTPDIKTLCERARINSKSGEIQIKWKCSNCGEFSSELNNYCDELVLKMENHYKLAVESLNDGKDIEARKLFEKFISNYSLVTHINHYLIYNSRSHLVGLYNFSNSNDSKMSYKYCKPIILSSNKVFPSCYHEKVHLFLNLADIIYKKEMIQKVSQRGVFNSSKDLIIECSWLSLYNSMVCYGPKSPIYYYCLSRMRLYSSILGVITPPSNMRIRIASIDLFSNLNREILGNSTVSKSAEYLSTLSDYSALLFIASIKGHLMGIAQLLVGQVKEILLNQVTYLPTGLNLLGMAASNLRDDVCALLLEEGSDLFFKNEYGITPIHALCTYPELEEECLNIQNDKKAAIIARDMIRKAVNLDIEKKSNSDQKENNETTEEQSVGKNACVRKMFAYAGKTGGENMPERGSNRYKLLYGKTIKWLGSNTPLHIAAYKGRKFLCSELIHGGTDPNVENVELAIPLHLASLNGHIETVDTLLKYGSEINKENYQGNTPLLLGIYGLKYETVRLLIDKGANLSHRSDILKMNAMHILALGLCCNTTLSFQLPKKLDDLPLISHNGYNNKDLKTYIYSMGSSHTGFGSNSSTKVLSIPIHTPIAEFLYISPREMLIRLKNCFDIMTFLSNSFDLTPLFIQRDANGFTPFELLNSSWNNFLKLRNGALLSQGLWYSSLSEEDKISTEELWSHIMQRVERLLEKFQVEEKIYDINDDDPELELPLPKKDYKGIPSLDSSDRFDDKNNEYLVRKGYLEPVVLRKAYCGGYSIGPDSTLYSQGQMDTFQIRELRELIMKRRKDHMETVFKKDKVSGKVGGNIYGKMVTSKSKSNLVSGKASSLLNPKATEAKSIEGKTSKISSKLNTPSVTTSLYSGKKELSVKSELTKTSSINSLSPKQVNFFNKNTDQSPKKLVLKAVLNQNNVNSQASPLKTLLKSPAIGVVSKPLVSGAKLDLSNVKIATPKKIEIKTNLTIPKTVAKIVVKSKLVPKKL